MNPTIYDMHNHTYRSHDSACDPWELCKLAYERNLTGIAITNHCDVHLSKTIDGLTPLRKSHEDVANLQKEYEGRMTILSGVEIGEGIWYPEEAEKASNLCDWDIVMGSVHVLRTEDPPIPYSLQDMTNWTEAQLHNILENYFNDLYETLCTMDFDILTHLTCPMRYISGKYGHEVDLSRYDTVINKILKGVIEKGISLEVNTSCKGGAYDFCMPDREYLQRYYDFGGRDLTIGSDSHVAENVGKALTDILPMLRQIGFDHLCYYVKREKQIYPLTEG